MTPPEQWQMWDISFPDTDDENLRSDQVNWTIGLVMVIQNVLVINNGDTNYDDRS